MFPDGPAAGDGVARGRLPPRNCARPTPKMPAKATIYGDALKMVDTLMKPKTEIKWRTGPEEQDYPAAKSYLSLTYPEREAGTLVRALKDAPMVEFKAKDIFRPFAPGGQQLPCRKRPPQDRTRRATIPPPPGAGQGQGQGDHRRRVPPTLCRLHVRRGRTHPLQDCTGRLILWLATMERL